MLSPHPFLHITLVNVNTQSLALKGVLETTDSTFLLIQEPWWGRVATSHSDTDPTGIVVYGSTAHPRWTVFTPPFPTRECPRVLTYIRSDVLPHLKINPTPDYDTYCSIGLDI